MACRFWKYDGTLKGNCTAGFPVTTGCFAEANSKLERNTISGVHCINEEWCGWAYQQTGGKPFKKEIEKV